MKRIFAVLLMVSMAALFGCGGGGSSSGGASVSKITGTASKGSAIPFGTSVTVTDAKGVVKTTTVGDNGIYGIDISGLTGPFLLQASSYYSSANGAGVTNINPLTDLCVKATLGTSTIPAILPTTFPGQFTTTVNTVLTSLDSLYPTTLTATKHFLDGDITLGAGVDLTFDYITITPPTGTSTAFSIAAKTSSTTATILTGSVSASSYTVTPANMTALSSIVFPSSAQYGVKFTTAMLTATTNPSFSYSATDGTYGSLSLQLKFKIY